MPPIRRELTSIKVKAATMKKTKPKGKPGPRIPKAQLSDAENMDSAMIIVRKNAEDQMRDAIEAQVKSGANVHHQGNFQAGQPLNIYSRILPMNVHQNCNQYHINASTNTCGASIFDGNVLGETNNTCWSATTATNIGFLPGEADMRVDFAFPSNNFEPVAGGLSGTSGAYPSRGWTPAWVGPSFHPHYWDHIDRLDGNQNGISD